MQPDTLAPSSRSTLARSWPSRYEALYRLLSLWALLLVLPLLSYTLISRDLWTDEAYTLSYTFHPTIGTLLEDVRKNEETPPLYFVSVWAWARLFGHGEEAIRGFSMLCGTFAVVVFAELARRRLAPAAALIATGVFLLSPLLQFYALEARAYTLALLLTTLCIAAFERLWERPERGFAQLAYGICASALFFTSYFGLVMIGAHWLLWLSQLRRHNWRARLGGWALAQALVAAPLLWWLPSLAYQVRAAGVMTLQTPVNLITTTTLQGTALMGYPLLPPLTLAWIVPAVAGWVLAATALVLRDRGGKASGRLSLRALGLPILMLMLLILATGAMHPRYTITLVPGLALAVGSGYRIAHRRLPRLAFTLLALLLAGMLLCRALSLQIPAHPLWPKLSQIVAEQARPGEDVVLFLPPWDQRIFEYYYQGPALDLAGAHHYDEFYYIQGHSFSQSWTTAEAVATTRGYRRVWHFYDPRYWDGRRLNLPYRELGHWQEGRLELTLYEVPAPGASQ